MNLLYNRYIKLYILNTLHEVIKLTYAFITTGTKDFMLTLLKKLSTENLKFLRHRDHALLYHETTKKTIFQAPRRYEIIEKTGEFPDKGLAVLHYIPVVDEFRPVFEYRMKNRPKHLNTTPGFLTSRTLRPLQSNTYLIITCWENRLHYESSKITDKIMESLGEEKSIEINQVKMYAGPSYIREYTIGIKDDTEEA